MTAYIDRTLEGLRFIVLDGELTSLAPEAGPADQLYDSFNIANARRWNLHFPSRTETPDYLAADGDNDEDQDVVVNPHLSAFRCLICGGTGRDRVGFQCKHCDGKGTRHDLD